MSEVTIGLPVYNGSPTLADAITSLLRQTYGDFVLYISDNCSTDETEAICRKFSQEDPRIVYHRHARLIPATENFRFVLDQATSEFFLWAAADDQRSPDYLQLNLAFLKEHPDFVASTSPTRFVGGAFDEVQMGDGSLDGGVESRILGHLSSWHANARFYSLFRRSVIADAASKDSHFLGTDWAIILRCLRAGRFHRVSSGWTLLGRQGESNGPRIFKLSRNHWYERIAPFAALSRVAFALTSDFSLASRARLAVLLARLNFQALVRLVRMTMRESFRRRRA